ncbi:MAG: hypothetical protein M9945_17435 [Aquamicrobium sp.]|uniref:hypothetical protein n=1 Tax=Aquamicrobium sp. TaxID=1872579 RepID=UPI00349EA878|nr:hypothetical protein [Aquamicrobium sp.]
MPVYQFARDRIIPLRKTTFGLMQIHERRDLQRLLRESISVIAPDTLVIAEEFGEWDDSRRRIDLLGVDRDANLVVIELKRSEDGGHMELQALRYAAMVSTMTFEQAADVFARYLHQLGREETDARVELLEHLGWVEPDHDQFGQDVKIVLASAEFSRELTTSVLWLLGRDIDIRCVRLQPYDYDGHVLVDVQQIIPLPEAAEYQIQVREKARKEREFVRTTSADFTRYDLTLGQSRHVSVPKRHALYLLFRHLVDRGHDPSEVAEHCGPRKNRALYSVEGEVERDEFLRLAEIAMAAGGRKFRPPRFFCEETELVRYNGRTYSFSNQWGGSEWLAAMTELKDAYPDAGIDFQASGSDLP